MKKFASGALFLLTAALGLVISYNTIPTFQNWVDDNIIGPIGPSVPGSSEPEEIPTLDAATTPIKILYAVNDEFNLQYTVEPANADHLDVTVTSSDSSAISIVSTSRVANVTTARIKCLSAFTGTKIVTGRATNGTATETDDYVVTTSCTFYVAVESIDLQLWTVLIDETNAITGYTQQVTNTVDLPVSDTQFYAFKIVVLPETATIQTASFSNTGGRASSGEETWISWNSDLVDEKAYSLDIATDPENPWTFRIVSTENAAITDTLTISVGDHYKSSNKSHFTPVIKINSDTTPVIQTIDQLEFRFMDEDQIQNPLNVGSCVKLEFAPNGFVEPQLTITYDVDYFEIVGINPAEGAIDNNDGTITVLMTSSVFVEFMCTSSTGSDYPSYISIKPSAYASVYAVEIPFVFSQPISGLTVDQTTVTL